MNDANYIVRHFGPLHHRWWNTQPGQRDGMVEETWRFGPCELTRHYVRNNKRYGSWECGVVLAWRNWRGPWLHFSFGSGAQDWDEEDDAFWKASDG